MLSHCSDDLSIPTVFIESLRRLKARMSPKNLREVAICSWRTILLLRNLPEVEISITRSIPGEQIGRFLRKRCYGFPAQVAATVLILPSVPSDYLKGRKKQAIRTNIARAVEKGFVVCKDVSGEDFWHKASKLRIRAIEVLCAQRLDLGMEDWCIYDENREIQAIARVQVDSTTAVLMFMGAVASEASGFARSQLSAAIFTDLAARGIKHLIVGSVFDLRPGLAYFQSRLGFQAMYLMINQSKQVATVRPRGNFAQTRVKPTWEA